MRAWLRAGALPERLTQDGELSGKRGCAAGMEFPVFGASVSGEVY